MYITNEDTELIEQAMYFSEHAHEGQFRGKKKTGGKGVPYFQHCEEVARYTYDNWYNLIPDSARNNLTRSDILAATISAAYLHDVLEDTKFTADDLLKEGFPLLTVEIVQYLTRQKDETYFSYIMKILDSGPNTCLIRAVKIADLICNARDLEEGSMKDKYRFAAYALSPRNGGVRTHPTF